MAISLEASGTYASDQLAAAKDQRKAHEAAVMRLDREATARAWTDEQAKARATGDAVDHAGLVDLGKRGDGEAYYLRSDMAMQARVNPAYDAALQAAAPALYARVQANEKDNIAIDLAAFHASNVGSEQTLQDESELTPDAVAPSPMG